MLGHVACMREVINAHQLIEIGVDGMIVLRLILEL